MTEPQASNLSAEEELQKIIHTMQVFWANSTSQVVRAEHQWRRTEQRHSTEQWLDENEREWIMMDTMMRSRPWATNKDSQFEYPFRKAVQDMREGGDVGWAGDAWDPPQVATGPQRREAPSKVLEHVRPVPEFPPRQRVIFFTPDMGSHLSYDMDDGWFRLCPQTDVDIWTVSWQGWDSFDEMWPPLMRKIVSFADGVSTVWYGHSFGAIIAYEALKRLERYFTPNLPVALMVSGCPAPHLFREHYRPEDVFPWLSQPKPQDAMSFSQEQLQTLARDFSMSLHGRSDAKNPEGPLDNAIPDLMANRLESVQKPDAVQWRTACSDIELMRKYTIERTDKEKRVIIPLFVFHSGADELVDESHAQAWSEYVLDDQEFGFIELDKSETDDTLEALGHGFAQVPTRTMRRKIIEIADKYEINKDPRSSGMLPDVGPTDKPIPEYVEHVIIGGGIAGCMLSHSMWQKGLDHIIVDRYDGLGGIWNFYANKFSRVNTSEVSYRVWDQTGIRARPNEDHSPAHDMLRDIYQNAAEAAYGKVYLKRDVIKRDKESDGTWKLTIKDLDTGKVSYLRCRTCNFATNRRIGKRRNVVYQDERYFRGDIVYGYSNEVVGLKFWGKRVIVVGAGAFAYENLRTAIEHGAKHATILGRRAGTTCPKWIDVIAFLRKMDDNFATHKGGSIISFQCWQDLYHSANLPTPECWQEGLLKPPNHTVSVSDLAYIGGYHGMVSLLVGEIQRFTDDGQGCVLKDGRRLEADIIIKATGFHLNEELPQIVGHDKMYIGNILDFNSSYVAEQLLDGAQFGSAKGMEDFKHMVIPGVDEWLDERGGFAEVLMTLPAGVQELFALRGNAFGSGFAGPLMAGGDFFAWLYQEENTQRRRDFADVAPKNGIAIKQWASHIGVLAVETAKYLLMRFVQLSEQMEAEGKEPPTGRLVPETYKIEAIPLISRLEALQEVL